MKALIGGHFEISGSPVDTSSFFLYYLLTVQVPAAECGAPAAGQGGAARAAAEGLQEVAVGADEEGVLQTLGQGAEGEQQLGRGQGETQGEGAGAAARGAEKESDQPRHRDGAETAPGKVVNGTWRNFTVPGECPYCLKTPIRTFTINN